MSEISASVIPRLPPSQFTEVIRWGTVDEHPDTHSSIPNDGYPLGEGDHCGEDINRTGA